MKKTQKKNEENVSPDDCKLSFEEFYILTLACSHESARSQMAECIKLKGVVEDHVEKTAHQAGVPNPLDKIARDEGRKILSSLPHREKVALRCALKEMKSETVLC